MKSPKAQNQQQGMETTLFETLGSQLKLNKPIFTLVKIPACTSSPEWCKSFPFSHIAEPHKHRDLFSSGFGNPSIIATHPFQQLYDVGDGSRG